MLVKGKQNASYTRMSYNISTFDATERADVAVATKVSGF